MVRKQTITVSLSPEQIEWLDDQAESRSQLIRDALREKYDL